MPTSCILTFYILKWCGLDPQWSISLATKYCANPDWIHLDTTLFNAVYRDAGSVLGKQNGILVSIQNNKLLKCYLQQNNLQ
jgi:glucose-6-phosphatase